MKLKTKLSKLRHDGHITDAEYAIIINVLNKFSTQPPNTQTCEDAISRAEVHDLLATWLSDYLTDETREALETIDGKVEDMPSVTPKPKIGYWIDIEALDSALWHECSECRETELYATNYCPNCGAKMEVEE